MKNETKQQLREKLENKGYSEQKPLKLAFRKLNRKMRKNYGNTDYEKFVKENGFETVFEKLSNFYNESYERRQKKQNA